jgi:hypothetical protein
MISVPTTQPNVPNVLSLIQSLRKQREDISAERLANEKARALAPFTVPSAQLGLASTAADIPLKSAQTQLALSTSKAKEAAAKSPLRGALMTGPAAQIASIEALKSQFGPDSPQVKMAQEGWDATVALQKSRGRYFDANYYFKNLPDVTKKQMTANWQSENAVRQSKGMPTLSLHDFMETGGRKLVPKDQQSLLPKPDEKPMQEPFSLEEGQAPEDSGKPHGPNDPVVMPKNPLPDNLQVKPYETTENFAKEANQTKAAIQLNTSDKDTRAKALNFQNLNEIMAGVDPKIITRYSGLSGLARRASDRMGAYAGSSDKGYEDYTTFVNVTVPTIADKVRQSYGTSIDPKMFTILKNVSNPVNWKNNPKMAISNWNQLRKLLQQQGTIYNNAIGAPISTTYIGAPGQQAPGSQLLQPAGPRISSPLARAGQGPQGAQPSGGVSQQLPPGITQAKIDHTMRKYGIKTQAELFQRLGIR